MIKTFFVASGQTISFKSPTRAEPKSPMNVRYAAAALMAAGLLLSAPAFAQTTPAEKQKTQEGTSMPGPGGGAFNADPDYKQRAQNLTPSPNENGIGNTK